MEVLYLGDKTKYRTSYHRACALRRLGNQVTHVDPRNALPDSKWFDTWIENTGSLFLEKYIKNKVLGHENVKGNKFDLVWLDQCNEVGPELVEALKNKSEKIICYIVDDPFSGRQRNWRLLLKAIPHYDLVAVVREPNVHEAYEYGAQDVVRVFRSADEEAHAPRNISVEEYRRYENDVVFVGAGWEDRARFMAELIERGVPLEVYGRHWKGQEGWGTVKPFHNPPAWGEEYVKVLQSAKVCLGLLSKRNRDLHTQRSAEIPYIGSAFCAKRTREHCEMYEEGKEAVFWDTPEECAEACFRLLRNTKERKRIAKKGRHRCVQNGHLNELVLEKIIHRAFN